MSGKLHEILPPDIYQVLADTRLAASASHRLRRNSLMIADVPGEYAKAPEVSLEFMSMVLVPDVIRIHEHQIAARRGLDALTEDLLGNGGTANPLEKAWRFAFHGWGIFWICSGVAKISQGRKPEPTEIAECLLQTWERILWPKIVALEPYDIELELLACDDAAKTAADRRKQRLLLNENKSTDEKPLSGVQGFPKRPSDKAFRAFVMRSTGVSANETAEHVYGAKKKQYQISRDVTAVEEYFKACGFPQESWMSKADKPDVLFLPPETIDLGRREDRHTSRQRDRFENFD